MLVRLRQATPLIFLIGCILSGCEPTNLYVAHHTVIGVNAAMNTERTSGRLVIGYDRKFVTVIPKSVPIDGVANKQRDAMAALSCSEVEVKGIFLSKFIEYLATGEAGKKFAERFGNTGDGAGIFECFDDNVSQN